jgi:hypothetical protein
VGTTNRQLEFQAGLERTGALGAQPQPEGGLAGLDKAGPIEAIAAGEGVSDHLAGQQALE